MPNQMSLTIYKILVTIFALKCILCKTIPVSTNPEEGNLIIISLMLNKNANKQISYIQQ